MNTDPAHFFLFSRKARIAVLVLLLLGAASTGVLLWLNRLSDENNTNSEGMSDADDSFAFYGPNKNASSHASGWSAFSIREASDPMIGCIYLSPGTLVARGLDWQWGNQDGGAGNIGTVIQDLSHEDSDGWVIVKWAANSMSNWYRITGGYCDLRLLHTRNNFVVVGSWTYSTVTDVPVHSSSISTQKYYLPVPSGWQIAPDNAESRSAIAQFLWSTHVVVMASGVGIRTSNFPPAGQVFGDHQSKYVTNSDGWVKCPWSAYQIIIRQAASGSSPAPAPQYSASHVAAFDLIKKRIDSIPDMAGSISSVHDVVAVDLPSSPQKTLFYGLISSAFGASYGWGSKSAIANLEHGKAYITTMGFHIGYWSKGYSALLGLPLCDEYGVGGGTRQDFELGSMFWSSSTGVYYQLNPPAASSPLSPPPISTPEHTISPPPALTTTPPPALTTTPPPALTTTPPPAPSATLPPAPRTTLPPYLMSTPPRPLISSSRLPTSFPSQLPATSASPAPSSTPTSNPAATTVLFDDFQSPELNHDNWRVVLSGGSRAASFVVGDGKLTMQRRAIIRTRAPLSFNFKVPLIISGSISFDHVSDYFQFYTRTNAEPSGIYDDLSDGLSFFIGTGNWGIGSNPRMTLCITAKGYAQTDVVLSSASTSIWAPEVGTSYFYRIIDAGTHAHIYINDHLLLVASNIPPTFMPGGHIALLNRETPLAQTSLGSLSISSHTSVAAPAPGPAPGFTQARLPSPPNAPPSPVLPAAPIALSDAVHSESSASNAIPIVASVFSTMGFFMIAAFAAVKIKRRIAARNELKCEMMRSSASEWSNFVTQLDISARVFISENWNASARRECGNIVHAELSPYLDQESPAVLNFRNGLVECDSKCGQFLWHGTSESSIVPICSGGFNPDMRQRSLHGQGEYFGRCPAASAPYAVENQSGLRRFLLCYVSKQTNVIGDVVLVDNPHLSQRKSFVLPVLVVTSALNALNPPLNCIYTSPFSTHRILYHQTDEASARAIMQQGFDMNKAAPGIAGRGLYFATHPRSTCHKSNKHGCTLRVTVNVGTSYLTARHPDSSDVERYGQGYLSLKIPRNDWTGHSTENGAEYVVIDARQVRAHAIMPNVQVLAQMAV
jgi:hypothetical protein